MAAMVTVSHAASAAQHLGPDMTLRATKVFLAYDEDRSGAIDVEELHKALRELGLELRHQRRRVGRCC